MALVTENLWQTNTLQRAMAFVTKDTSPQILTHKFLNLFLCLFDPGEKPYMQKTCDDAVKAILAKKNLRKKSVNRDKMSNATKVRKSWKLIKNGENRQKMVLLPSKMVLPPSKMVLPPSKMVLPQAMAWVQYWFRVLSLKFCGKSKKICGDISPQSPAFCMYEFVLLWSSHVWVWIYESGRGGCEYSKL